MPVCYYCHYNIREFNLEDGEPGDEYTIMPLNGEEIAICEACMDNRKSIQKKVA